MRPKIKQLSGCLSVVAVTSFLTLTAQPATAAVQASAGLSNIYLDRGVDLSDGNVQFFGDLSFTSGLGLYAGIWGSSYGNGSQEYDLSVGWAKSFGDIKVNFGVVNYMFPGEGYADDLGSESEMYLAFDWKGFELAVYDNIASAHADNSGYSYYAFSYTYNKFSGTLGYASDDSIPNAGGIAGLDGEYGYAHLDLTYGFNDNLSFTFSKMIDRDLKLDGSSVSDSHYDDVLNGGVVQNQNFAADSRFSHVADADMLFVITYSLPLEF